MVLDSEKYIHFIGIGGISMSSLANILLTRGYKVSGSDSKESALTKELEELGAKIHIGQSADNISDEIGLVVYTAAISDDNPELMAVREANIPELTRADFLGRLMREYDNVICISGTHGKTTTTSLISQIFLDAEKDPTILCGGIIPVIGGNTRIGHSGHMIAEACEYTNSFLSFFPRIAVILNVQADHLDFFKDIDDIRASFKKFASLLPDDGALVINGEIDNISYFTDGLNCKVVTYGMGEGFDFTAENITFDAFACGGYDLVKNGQVIGHVQLSIPGEHNVSNSLAAAAVADLCGIDTETILNGLGRFSGVERRFEFKGILGGATVIDDYAHHPDEINATLSAAIKYPHKKLWVVFQPHTYTRTIALMDEFASALSRADTVILPDIYAAREKNIYGVSSGDLQKKIAELGTESYYIPEFDDVENFLLENITEGDLLITMGAGNVVEIGDYLLGK
ncbi:MAG: UDP-N-acetylmuramate--L-alanine ligase [Lachnospiraceae bacterium]|nr:UDP-N-acetylmuramate--L-alanine ligase [Lachnospiraceae bacterium]